MVIVLATLVGLAGLVLVINKIRATPSRIMDFEEGEDGFGTIALGSVTILVSTDWERMGGFIWLKGHMQWRDEPRGILKKRILPFNRISESDGQMGRSFSVTSFEAEGERREEYRVSFRITRVNGHRRLVVTLKYVR